MRTCSIKWSRVSSILEVAWIKTPGFSSVREMPASTGMHTGAKGTTTCSRPTSKHCPLPCSDPSWQNMLLKWRWRMRNKDNNYATCMITAVFPSWVKDCHTWLSRLTWIGVLVRISCMHGVQCFPVERCSLHTLFALGFVFCLFMSSIVVLQWKDLLCSMTWCLQC